jgi:hypothetical protein
MQHQRDVRVLWQQLCLIQIASIGLMGFGGLMIGLFLDPRFLGGNSNNTDPIWFWVGVGFIAFAIFCMGVSFQHYRRLMWIFRNVQPQTMQLVLRSLRSMDSTDYTAILDDEWQVRVNSPPWKVNPLQTDPLLAQVYFDPKSHRPVLIQTPQGLLVALAGRSAWRSPGL